MGARKATCSGRGRDRLGLTTSCGAYGRRMTRTFCPFLCLSMPGFMPSTPRCGSPLALPMPLLCLCAELSTALPLDRALAALLAAMASSVYAPGSTLANTLNASRIGRYPVHRLRDRRTNTVSVLQLQRQGACSRAPSGGQGLQTQRCAGLGDLNRITKS